MNAQHHRILIVDDSPEDREAYRRLIIKGGKDRYVVAEAASGEEGLSQCRSAPPDCILLDYTLPDIDGLEFLDRLAADHADLVVSVVFLTGTGNEAVAVRALKQGAEDYLIKRGVTVDGFQNAIHGAIEKAILRRRIEQQRKELERRAEELRESEEKFRNAVANASIGFVMATPGGAIVDANLAFCQLIGYDADELLSFDFVKLIHPDDRAVAVDSVKRILAGDIPAFVVESRFLRKDGGVVWVRKSISTTPDDSGRPKWIINLTEDVTERRKAEDELRRLNASLEQRVRDAVQAREEAQSRLALSEKLSALGQLAGGVAHDFNNIMQGVIGGASIIQRRARDPTEVIRYARMIDETARRGVSVTSRLLTLARRDDLRAEPVNVAALLKGLRELLRHTLGAAIVIKLDVAEDLALILADQSRLETVLVNLATNARDAMREGGVITISACSETVADGVLSSELAPGGYVRFVVSDTGVGMDKTTLRRALEPFFTTKERGKGTGLGLSMACGFAEQSGGALKVFSEPGCGTIVTLWLPMAKVTNLQSETPEQAALSVYSKGRRLLLVDDEMIVREVLAGELVDHGYDVVQAESGFVALNLIDAGESLDLIISDLAMPGMDGIALIHAAQERRKSMPAILLTGNAGDYATLTVGATAAHSSFTLLRKPITGALLADQIARLLEAAGSASPS